MQIDSATKPKKYHFNNNCCPHLRECRWAVGSNIPNYVPEDHVEHFDNFHSATKALYALVEAAYGRAIVGTTDPAHWKVLLDERAKALNTLRTQYPRDIDVHVGDRVYWVCKLTGE